MAISSGTSSGPLALVSQFRGYSSSHGILPATNHPQPRRKKQKSRHPTNLTGSASCSRVVLPGHLFSGHRFLSEQHVEIASEPARVISEEYAIERIAQVRMDIQRIEVICQIESAHRKSQ